MANALVRSSTWFFSVLGSKILLQVFEQLKTERRFLRQVRRTALAPLNLFSNGEAEQRCSLSCRITGERWLDDILRLGLRLPSRRCLRRGCAHSRAFQARGRSTPHADCDCL